MLYHDGLRTIAAENARHSSISRATPSDHSWNEMYRTHADNHFLGWSRALNFTRSPPLMGKCSSLSRVGGVPCGVDETP